MDKYYLTRQEAKEIYAAGFEIFGEQKNGMTFNVTEEEDFDPDVEFFLLNKTPERITKIFKTINKKKQNNMPENYAKTQTAAKIDVMQAFLDGEQIECQFKDEPGEWYPIDAPKWDWDGVNYRVKKTQIAAADCVVGEKYIYGANTVLVVALPMTIQRYLESKNEAGDTYVINRGFLYSDNDLCLLIENDVLQIIDAEK